MCGEAFITILTRAMRQPEFRDLLMRAPDEALAGYTLSPADSYRLRTLTPEVFDQLAADIKARLTPPVSLAERGARLN